MVWLGVVFWWLVATRPLFAHQPFVRATLKNPFWAEGLNSVAFSSGGKLLASGSLDRTIKLWNVAPGKQAAAPPAQC